MKASVNWVPSQAGLAFEGKTETGHTLKLDGNGEGLSPMESVLLSVGACSSVDVVEIMRKARQTLESCEVELSAQRAENPPRIFTEIHANFVVRGQDINEKHLKRAVELSTEKYCSVMLMLNKAVKITTSYEIR
ncbi:OsmC family protein [Glaciecola sp. KUL10]|jgi:putative redox protein|uniref:OsmC family protein n=1 Tax=Glaciecola sp. (strain KUL10) TaxID=2161813 RepID=UPI000D78B19B|nr:OsmC family protein [Glaciecola sp. KUL10]GBL02780.1 OsmC-like protein [Glaciecola sp. KUL10]